MARYNPEENHTKKPLTHYELRAAVLSFLDAHTDKRYTAKKIAATIGSSWEEVATVCRELANEGYRISGRTGPGGGYKLDPSSDSIKLAFGQTWLGPNPGDGRPRAKRRILNIRYGKPVGKDLEPTPEFVWYVNSLGDIFGITHDEFVAFVTERAKKDIPMPSEAAIREAIDGRQDQQETRRLAGDAGQQVMQPKPNPPRPTEATESEVDENVPEPAGVVHLAEELHGSADDIEGRVFQADMLEQEAEHEAPEEPAQDFAQEVDRRLEVARAVMWRDDDEETLGRLLSRKGYCKNCKAPRAVTDLPPDMFSFAANRLGGRERLQRQYVLDLLERVSRERPATTFGDLFDWGMFEGWFDWYCDLPIGEAFTYIGQSNEPRETAKMPVSSPRHASKASGQAAIVLAALEGSDGLTRREIHEKTGIGLASVSSCLKRGIKNGTITASRDHRPCKRYHRSKDPKAP